MTLAAAGSKDIKILKFIFEKGYDDINEYGPYKMPILINAVMSGNYENVQFLLDKGADIKLTYETSRNDELDHMNSLAWAKKRIEQAEKYGYETEGYKKCYEILFKESKKLEN